MGDAMVVESNGMPTKAARAPAARSAAAVGSTSGAPMNVAIPPTRTECQPCRVCCEAIDDMPAPSYSGGISANTLSTETPRCLLVNHAIP